MTRTLYCPIFESGVVHPVAVKYKRGLYNALCAYGPVLEFDYLANDDATRYDGFVQRINEFQPDLMVTQFHGANILSPEQIRELRALRPEMIICNWSGDSHNHGLIAPPILAMAREFDVQLVAAPDVLPIYEAEGINAAFWNIGYEPPVGPLPEMPTWDVVWLANVINEKRLNLMERLKSLPDLKVGIYGDWSGADGNNVYDFPTGEALYKNAKLAIADNVYPDTQHYISNRPMQIMAAGGAMLLHQHVPRMEEISLGWRDGEHYVEWADADDLIDEIRQALSGNWNKKIGVQRIVAAAQQHVLTHHSYDARARQLFTEFIPAIEKARVQPCSTHSKKRQKHIMETTVRQSLSMGLASASVRLFTIRD